MSYPPRRVRCIERSEENMEQGDKIEFHKAGEEWTVVYLNGVLQRVGDSYLADEWLQSYVGVEIVYDSVCMIDDHKAYPTLDEVHAATRARDERQERAAELEREAAALLERAREMRA